MRSARIELRRFARPGARWDRLYRLCWGLVQSTLFRHSPRVCWAWRSWILRGFGAAVGRGVKLDPTCRVFDPRKLAIGDDCWIGPCNELYSAERIVIGRDVALAQHVYLYTASHDIEDPLFRTVTAPITIRDQAWLAADTFVGPGVTVGEGAVLGARSSAFRDLPPWTVCLGTPARPVRPRVLRESGNRMAEGTSE